MIGVLNYGCGNIKSIVNALNEIQASFKIVNNYKEIKKIDKIIIPGVGAYSNAIKKFKKLNFHKEIIEFSNSNPVLGICLGMQILSNYGEEFTKTNGLGLIDGKVTKIDNSKNISHVGWNSIILKSKDGIFKDIDNMSDFYFVHAYEFNLKSSKDQTSKVSFNKKYITMIIYIKKLS